jgi:hypothetical protein
MSGQSRNHIAAIDAVTGNVTSWNPNANYYVRSLAVRGTTIYAGGVFTSIGGQNRIRVAALDATTGNALAWNPTANEVVLSLVPNGRMVFIGGAFTGIGGLARNNIAEIDAATGTATPWNPNANSSVQTLFLNGKTVYAGGTFTIIGGQNRGNIAALDASTGAATSWNPNANAGIYALALSGSRIYAGGYFTSIGGQSRRSIAALDTTAGNAIAWDPNPSAGSTIYSLAISGPIVYAGGDFISIGGQSYSCIAALDSATGNATLWNPNANNTVRSIAMSGQLVYAGGAFTIIGGQTRYHIAALDAASGVASPWNPNADASVYSLAVSGTTVYAGGAFTRISGQTRTALAGLDATSGYAVPWNPASNGNGTVSSIAVSGANMFAGGYIFGLGLGEGHSHFAQFSAISYPAPVLLSISPYSTTNSTSTQVSTLGGSNFRSGAAVKLVKAGQSDINATSVSTISSTQISCIFDMINASSGIWDVVVINDDSQSDTLAQVFAVVYPPPLLVSPVNNAINIGLMPTLTWHKAQNDSIYALQISGTSTFSIRIIDDSVITDTAVVLPSALLVHNMPYYWKVAVTKKGGQATTFCTPWVFTTVMTTPGAVALVSPAPNDTLKVDSVFLTWHASVPVADRYKVEYDADSLFASPTIDSTITDTNKLVRNLQPNSTVWWRVQAHNSTGWGTWSTKYAFEIRLPSTHAGVMLIPKAFSFAISGQRGSIRYALPKAEQVSLRLYSINGQLQAVCVNKRQEAGYYTFCIQKGIVARGPYLAAYRAGDYYQKKMIFLVK